MAGERKKIKTEISSYSIKIDKPELPFWLDELLNWDLDDLKEDISAIKGEMSDSQSLRSSFRSKLSEQLLRYKELQKMLKTSNHPAQSFPFIPGIEGIREISEEDIQEIKISYIQEMHQSLWKEVTSNYINGSFLSSILACATDIELIIKYIALRDNKKLYKKIKGKSGFGDPVLINFQNCQKFEEIKKDLKNLWGIRCQIATHPIHKIEQRTSSYSKKINQYSKGEGKIFSSNKILNQFLKEKEGIFSLPEKWHKKEPHKRYGAGAYSITPFQNLAKNYLEETIKVMKKLWKIKLDTK